MKTKVCFKCSIEKPISDYYKHKAMGDGHLNKCISCTKNDVEERYKLKLKDPLFLESERERGRNKYHRLGYKNIQKPSNEERKPTTEKYYAKYPEKILAKNRLSTLRRELAIVDSDVQLHHWSYNIEHLRDVITLSSKRHYLIHRFIKYDPSNKMYKTLSGELLDTKQKHIDYIKSIILNKNIAA